MTANDNKYRQRKCAKWQYSKETKHHPLLLMTHFTIKKNVPSKLFFGLKEIYGSLLNPCFKG